MALRINYNFESVSAQRNLTGTQNSFFRAIEQLSSGLRINKAADDAAGLAVSEKLKNQVRGLNQAQRNAQDGISLVQTAEGALSETHNILARMRELSIQSANDTLTNSDRVHIQAEVNQLLSEVDRIAVSTTYNKIALLGGAAVRLHVGPNNDTSLTAGQNEMVVNFVSSYASGLGVDTASVSAQRGLLGAYQNRLQSTINSLGVASENTGAANSRIRDADVAAAVAEMTRTQILQQATMAVLAQANQSPQMALQLLK
jgi:flagellin